MYLSTRDQQQQSVQKEVDPTDIETRATSSVAIHQ